MLLHNRLTHSLKVEQVGLSLFSKLHENDTSLAATVDRNAIAAACLAHDLGHPPFGHAGEQELHSLVVCRKHRATPRTMSDRRGDPCGTCLLEDGFEGNAQSFRIVTALAVHKSWREVAEDKKFYGMDLTAATLQATTKYPWARGDNPSKRNKWGAYDLDVPTLDLLTGGSQELALAAQIMDWADDISYAAHDLEDFYRTGHIPLDQYRSRTEAVAEFLEYVESAAVLGPVKKETKEALTGLIELYFPTRRFAGDPEEISDLDELRSQMLTKFIEAATVIGADLQVEDLQADLNRVVKQFTWYHVIDDPKLANIQAGQRRVLREIFHALRAQVVDVYRVGKPGDVDRRGMRRLPRYLQWAVEVALGQPGDGTKSERVHRGLIDYIASLSDSDAYHQHSVLKGREPVGHL
jgi:dGTPase